MDSKAGRPRKGGAHVEPRPHHMKDGHQMGMGAEAPHNTHPPNQPLKETKAQAAVEGKEPGGYVPHRPHHQRVK